MAHSLLTIIWTLTARRPRGRRWARDRLLEGKCEPAFPIEAHHAPVFDEERLGGLEPVGLQHELEPAARRERDAPPASAQPRSSDQRRARRASEHGIEPARRRLRFLFEQRDHEALQADGEAGGRGRGVERREHTVVASASAERHAQTRRVGLGDEARVVAERAHDREVDHHVVTDACGLEQLPRRGELVERDLASQARGRLPARGDRVAPATYARHRREGDRDGSRAASASQPVETDEIAVVSGDEHRLAPLGRRCSSRNERVQHRDRTHGDREIGEAGSTQRLDEHRDPLGVGGRTRLAHQLDAQLGELARLTAERLVLAEHLRRVAETVRAGLPCQTRRGETRDRHGHVRAQREQTAIEVDQAKRRPFERTRRSLERRKVLDHGSLHKTVAPRREDVSDTMRYRLSLCGLGWKHISESARCDRTHELVPLANTVRAPSSEEGPMASLYHGRVVERNTARRREPAKLRYFPSVIASAPNSMMRSA